MTTRALAYEIAKRVQGAYLISVGEFISHSPCRPGKAAGARALKLELLEWARDIAMPMIGIPLADAIYKAYHDRANATDLEESLARAEVYYGLFRERAMYTLRSEMAYRFPQVGRMITFGLLMMLICTSRTAFQMGLGEMAEQEARRDGSLRSK